MNLKAHSLMRRRIRSQAFTLVEVALCLAIIGFALVAIIGILPTGMNVQTENREKTVVGQDGLLIMEALRSGQTNVTRLAENLEWIQLYTNGVLAGSFNRSQMLSGTITTNDLAYRIVGLLSTPRFEFNAGPPGYVSNYVRAKFVGDSGPLSDRLTEGPGGTRDMAFSYLVTVNIDRAVLSQVNSNGTAVGADFVYGGMLHSNLYDLRVTVSWPVYPNTNTGNGRKVFQTLVAGKLEQDTNFLYRFRPGEFTGVQ